jgi:hypothetical protein
MRGLAILLGAGLVAASGPLGAPPAGCGPGPLCRIIVPVNIVGTRADGTPDDRRGMLRDLAGGLGLSAADVTRIRGATGVIICRLDKERVLGSAVLVGRGVVLTVAHMLRDSSEGFAEFPRGTPCRFRTQAVPPQEVSLLLDGSEVLGAGGQDDLNDTRDYAVLRLAAPLTDVEPFEVGAPVAVKTGLILISGFQWDMPVVAPSEPIAQLAEVETEVTPPNAPRAYFLRGAMETGGSGGVALVRQDGVLKAVGIVSSTGNTMRNGWPFSVENSSFVRVIALEGAVVDAIGRLAHAP